MRVLSLVWATVAMNLVGVMVFLAVELVGMVGLMWLSNKEEDRTYFRGVQLAFVTIPAIHWQEEMEEWGVLVQACWRAVTQLVMAVLPALADGICTDGEKPSEHGCLPPAWLMSMLVLWVLVYLVLMPFFLSYIVYRKDRLIAAMVVLDGSRVQKEHLRASDDEEQQRSRKRGSDSGDSGGDDSDGSGETAIPIVVTTSRHKRQLGNIA